MEVCGRHHILLVMSTAMGIFFFSDNQSFLYVLINSLPPSLPPSLAQPDKTAEPAEDLLLGQPTAGRPDQGAAGGDDRAVVARHPRLVPEQAVQGQEEAGHEAWEGERILPSTPRPTSGGGMQRMEAQSEYVYTMRTRLGHA